MKLPECILKIDTHPDAIWLLAIHTLACGSPGLLPEERLAAIEKIAAEHLQIVSKASEVQHEVDNAIAANRKERLDKLKKK